MALGKKSIVAGFAALTAAMGGWFYKVATTEPVADVKTSEEPKKEEMLLDGSVVPAAKPEPELSWYEWAKSYMPSLKMETNTTQSKEKSTGEIIHDQLRGM